MDLYVTKKIPSTEMRNVAASLEQSWTFQKCVREGFKQLNEVWKYKAYLLLRWSWMLLTNFSFCLFSFFCFPFPELGMHINYSIFTMSSEVLILVTMSYKLLIWGLGPYLTKLQVSSYSWFMIPGLFRICKPEPLHCFWFLLAQWWGIASSHSSAHLWCKLSWAR